MYNGDMPRGQTPQRGLEPRNCVACGEGFQPYRDFHVSCGKRRCRARAKELNPLRVESEIQCRYCKETFTVQWSGIGRKPPCPSCAEKLRREKQERQNAARRLETAVDPEARKAINLKYALVRYGITPEDLVEMLAAQEGLCAICGNSADPNGTGAAGRLHVDHDHVTGKVRSLLCNHCNRAIGGFRDDPALMRAGAEYVERHRINA